MFCPNCGARLPDGSAFCGSCGARLDGGQPVQQAASPQTAQQPYIQKAPYPQPAKKKPWGLIGGAAAAVAVLALILLVWPGVLRGEKAEPDTKNQEQAVTSSKPTGDSNSEKPLQQTVPARDEKPSTGGNLLSLPGDPPHAEPNTEPAQPDAEPTQPSTESQSAAEGALIDPAFQPSQDSGATAAFYSTDADASALEFDWFLDLVLGDGSAFSQMFSNMEAVTDPTLLDGGWKAYMRGNGEMDNDVERYLHAELQSSGDNGKITLRWKYMLIPGSGTVEESGSSTFSGTWDGGQLYATGSGNLKLDTCFASNGKQYAYGTFLWPSGEVDYIALMRP